MKVAADEFHAVLEIQAAIHATLTAGRSDRHYQFRRACSNGITMIFRDKNRVQLTRSELNLLRQRNAQNGIAITDVKTAPQLLEAVISGLSPERAADLLAFMDGHSTSDDADPDAGDEDRR